jgi:adenine-specific DNA-methyltransferase
MSKKNYSNWSREDLIKEIEKLRNLKGYGIVWESDQEKAVELLKEKLPILKEVKDKDIKTDENKPVHILIEGDNFHALSVLNFTHRGAIDVIYIDPPYNIGSGDFIFNDKYVKKEDTYRHSNWIAFMEKRLRLAKKLLKDTGVIFISIDNNELAQLKLLCDEIFLEKNFVENLIWRKKTGSGQQDQFFVTEHEYILVYARNKEKCSLIEKTEMKTYEDYKFYDEKKQKKYRLSKLAKWGAGALREDRPTMHFSIKDPDSNENFPVAPDGRPGRWRYGNKRVMELIETDSIEWVKKNGVWIPYERDYESSEDEVKTMKQRSILYDLTTTTDGTNELTNIFGIKDKFTNPKPVLLIKYLLSLTANKNAIFLDFFSGSGTSGHAILELNKEDGGNRKFILCTDNENDICTEICYPRIEKVIKGYKNVAGKEIEGFGGNLKYFKIDFVDAEPTDRNKKKLAEQSTEMLCLKEDCFDEVESGQYFKIFKSNNEKYVGIVFDDEGIEPFKEKVKKLNKKINVYVFSLDESAREEEFEDISNLVNLISIPEVTLNVYRRILK